jgi:NMD protein affecting ribosome stability and mRNA decay
MDMDVPYLLMSQEIILVCVFCGKRKDELEGWLPADEYCEKKPHAAISHGICPECASLHYSREYDGLLRERQESQ